MSDAMTRNAADMLQVSTGYFGLEREFNMPDYGETMDSAADRRFLTSLYKTRITQPSLKHQGHISIRRSSQSSRVTLMTAATSEGSSTNIEGSSFPTYMRRHLDELEGFKLQVVDAFAAGGMCKQQALTLSEAQNDDPETWREWKEAFDSELDGIQQELQELPNPKALRRYYQKLATIDASSTKENLASMSNKATIQSIVQYNRKRARTNSLWTDLNAH
jgi:hypothetical protein